MPHSRSGARYLPFALAVLALCGCGSASDASEDPASADDVAPLLAGRQVSEQELAGLLDDAGFPKSAIPRMVCAAKYESSFYSEAQHRNKNGSVTTGSFKSTIAIGSTPAE
jgi:hypothetical protein